MAASPVRTLHSAEIITDSDGEIRLEFIGNGFLSHQVRIMSGTLVEVGLGARSPASLPALLGAKDRGAAGPTLPGQGLTLVWVKLGEGPVAG